MQVKDKRKSRRGVGVLALVCLVCHLALAPNIALGNGRANFALVFAEVVALSVGGPTGVLCGFLGGLVYDLSSTGPIGLMAFLLTAAAYPLGMEVHDRIGEDPGSTYVPVAVTTLVVTFVYHLAMLLVGQSTSFFEGVVFRTLPTALLTFLAYIPFAVVLGRSTRGGGRRLGTPSVQGARRAARHSLRTR